MFQGDSPEAEDSLGSTGADLSVPLLDENSLGPSPDGFQADDGMIAASPPELSYDLMKCETYASTRASRGLHGVGVNDSDGLTPRHAHRQHHVPFIVSHFLI